MIASLDHNIGSEIASPTIGFNEVANRFGFAVPDSIQSIVNTNPKEILAIPKVVSSVLATYKLESVSDRRVYALGIDESSQVQNLAEYLENNASFFEPSVYYTLDFLARFAQDSEEGLKVQTNEPQSMAMCFEAERYFMRILESDFGYLDNFTRIATVIYDGDNPVLLMKSGKDMGASNSTLSLVDINYNGVLLKAGSLFHTQINGDAKRTRREHVYRAEINDCSFHFKRETILRYAPEFRKQVGPIEMAYYDGLKKPLLRINDLTMEQAHLDLLSLSRTTL